MQVSYTCLFPILCALVYRHLTEAPLACCLLNLLSANLYVLEVNLINPHFINFVIPITSLHALCSATLSDIAMKKKKKNKPTKEESFQRKINN